MKMIEQIMFHSLTHLPTLKSLRHDQNNCSFFFAAMQLPASVVSAGARREESTQLFLRVLTLDVASGFLHEGVFISQVLLNQLEDAMWVFAPSLIECQQAASSEIFPAEKQSVSLADMYPPPICWQMNILNEVLFLTSGAKHTMKAMEDVNIQEELYLVLSVFFDV